jgi:hypothetical protein
MKFRIVEASNFDGVICYTPQYKKFFMWMSFMDFDFPPKTIKFYSMENAKNFILKQKNKVETKYHYYP